MIKKNFVLVLLLGFTLQASAECRIDTSFWYDLNFGSSVKNLRGRDIYQYNSAHKVVTKLMQEWNGFSFVNVSKDSFAYASPTDTVVLYHLKQNYNTVTSLFENEEQEINEYLLGGKHIIQTSYQWIPTTSSWRAVNQLEIKKNIYNLDSIVNSKSYSPSAGTLVDLIQAEITFTPTPAYWVSISQVQIWNPTTSTWIPESRTIFHLPNLNELKPTLDSMNVWMASTSTWEPYFKNIINYNSQNNITQSIRYVYNDILGWDFSGRETYTYAGNNLTEYLEETFNGSAWQNEKREVYLYNAAQKIIETSEYEWLTASMTWDPTNRKRSEYNTSNELIATSEEHTWSASDLIFSIHNRYEYKCTSINTNIVEAFKFDKFTLFPNPVYGHILVLNAEKENEMEITDIQGKIVFKKSLYPGENTMDVGNLLSGIYLVKVGNSIQKLIKQ